LEPLWKIRSGKFAGHRSGDLLYDADGKNVGYLNDAVAYSTNGHYIGEMYNDDYIGKRTAILHSVNSPRVRYANIASARYADRAGLAIAGWEDPDF
jgi:hypothetical protein